MHINKKLNQYCIQGNVRHRFISASVEGRKITLYKVPERKRTFTLAKVNPYQQPENCFNYKKDQYPLKVNITFLYIYCDIDESTS